VLADWQADGSTGGIALAYATGMRNAILTLSLSLLFLACGDDGEPTRPADGTVEVWESCVWDGQVTFDLCQPELQCSWNGICSPVCEDLADCPVFEGFDNDCVVMEGKKICKPLCNAANECPETGAEPLHCLDGYCIGST
jgi:hypothetical protein